MNQGQKFTVEGYVTEELPGTKFKVKISVGGKEHEITAYLSGKMRMNYIKILEGDFVKVEMTPYDLTQGRIIFREKVKSSGSTFVPKVDMATTEPSATVEGAKETSPAENADEAKDIELEAKNEG